MESAAAAAAVSSAEQRDDSARAVFLVLVVVNCSESSVILRWGFHELGRTAIEYRQLFGEVPSSTLADIP